MVNASHDERLAQQRAMERDLAAIEASFTKSLIKEKNRAIDALVQDYIRTRRVNEDMTLITHITNMQGIFRKHIGDVIRKHGRATINSLQSGKKHYQKFVDEFAQFFFSLETYWMANFGANRARLTSETTRDDVQRVLLLAQDEGLDNREIVKKLLGVKELSRFRAETIARTESHNAAIFASERSAEKIQSDAGVTLLKFWSPKLDERTRISHAFMIDSEGIPLDGMFVVGGERLKRPGDPNGSASNTINCRCALYYKEKE